MNTEPGKQSDNKTVIASLSMVRDIYITMK